MAASPFAFFRGAALPMAADLSTLPTTGLLVQACGDAHIANFGGYRSPESHLVFDLNDFDETTRGPWEWDVERLVASVAICGRTRGFGDKWCREAVQMCIRDRSLAVGLVLLTVLVVGFVLNWFVPSIPVSYTHLDGLLVLLVYIHEGGAVLAYGMVEQE